MDKINDTIIKIVSMDEISKPQRLLAKTGDVNGRDLYVQLEDKDGKGINTADARLTLAYKTPSGIINEIAFVPVNAEEGLYGLTYDAGLTHEAGVVTATIRLKTYDTTTETPNFEIYVEGSPLEGIHFTEVDGLTFKKVMDKVDSIDFRAGLIEDDILKIDEQLQDMNTRIVYVEEDDSIDERVYNNENDIQLLEREVERLDTELDNLRLEVANIEVVGGGGNSGNIKDTGWRVVMDYEFISSFGQITKVYVRRINNEVKVYCIYEGYTTASKSHNLGIVDSSKGINGYPDMFKESVGSPPYVMSLKSYGTGPHFVPTVVAGSFVTNTGSGDPNIHYTGTSKGQQVGTFITNRPFTDEYMDLPLADFT